MVYAVGAYVGSNHLAIGRNNDGQVVVQATNMQGRDMGFLGAVTGSARITFGNTDGGYGTAHQVEALSGTRFDITDASQNIQFNNSSNLGINVLDNNHEANIELNNVKGSTVDATNTSRALGLYARNGSNNNIFNMGWADANIIDGGSFNITSLGSGNTYYASTTTSNGAVVLGGAGNATYQIAGNYGVFKQGTGTAIYQINANKAGTAGNFNTILSTSLSSIKDQGFASYIYSTNANSTVEMNGIMGLAELGTLSRVTFGENALDNLAFAGGVCLYDGVYGSFDLGASLRDRGYYGSGVGNFLTVSGHGVNQTSSLVSSLLADALERGNSGYDNLSLT